MASSPPVILPTVRLGATRRLDRWWIQPLVIGVGLLSLTASSMAVLLQMRFMEVAGSAQMLGAALNHSALNAANALGAWLGGVVIEHGPGLGSLTWTAALVTVSGIAVALWSLRLDIPRRVDIEAGTCPAN